MNALPKLFVEAAEASRYLRVIRQSAREKAIVAVRAMEHALVEALDGETLKGLPDLAPGLTAARVRSGQERLPVPQGETPGREVLVVTTRGALAMVRLVDDGCVRVQERPADDADLLAEDAEQVARLFAELLGEHVERSRKSTEKFGRLEDLAEKLAQTLDPRA